MPYDKKAFGIVISKLRVEKGLTQERFSGLAGIAIWINGYYRQALYGILLLGFMTYKFYRDKNLARR